MMPLLALVPIVLILLLMVGLRWGASQAGAAGYLSALIISILFFGAGPTLLAYAHTRALLLALDVLLIIWAAFLFYRVAEEAGAIRSIGIALPHLTADRGLQVLIIGWVFASFLQGVGGFGVPVAVIAPLMVGLGFSPLLSVVLPSLGTSWNVSFGSLGSSFQALLSSTGMQASQLASPTGIMLGGLGLLAGVFVAHALGGWRCVRLNLFEILVLGLVMAITQYIVAVIGLWNIAAFAGGAAGLIASLFLARRRREPFSEPWVKSIAGNTSSSPTMAAEVTKTSLDLPRLATALSAYVILVIVILTVQLIPNVKSFLGQVVIRVPFPEVQTSLGYITPAGFGRSISVFNHPGASLGYTALVAFLVYWRSGLYRAGSLKRILNGTINQLIPSSLGILSMISMAVIMEQAGMTDQLASLLAGGVGPIFPLAAPWIGALGAFMTGSNTNANVVFGALQLRTSELLGFNPAPILAAQTSGAAAASIIAPAKVVVGASTAGMVGSEGEVMRHLLGYVVALVTLVSLMAALGVLFFGGTG